MSKITGTSVFKMQQESNVLKAKIAEALMEVRNLKASPYQTANNFQVFKTLETIENILS